jgi:hypothetical protein
MVHFFSLIPKILFILSTKFNIVKTKPRASFQEILHSHYYKGSSYILIWEGFEFFPTN